MAKGSAALDALPSLPQVLVRLLEEVSGERVDFARLAGIVGQDPAMAARLLAVANSSRFAPASPCRTLERALLVLGVDTVKTIVITEAIKQFFNNFSPHHRLFLKAFWRRSLLTAHFAHIFANLTAYRAPDQAYLMGLLCDLGQLMLLREHGDAYVARWRAAKDDPSLLAAEQALAGERHPDVGAAALDSWGLDAVFADAVRLHHEDVDLALDAHHLVKIAILSSLLSAPRPLSDQTLIEADRLFGLNEALVRELRERVNEDVEGLAAALSIDLSEAEPTQDVEHAHRQLGVYAGELGQMGRLSRELGRAGSAQALEEAIKRTVFLALGLERCFLFRLDRSGQRLRGSLAEGPGQAEPLDLDIAIVADRSLVATALIENRIVSTDGQESPRTVVDRQLLRACRSARLLCLPLHEGAQAIGVLVLGVDASASLPSLRLIGLGREIAAALARFQAGPSGDMEAGSAPAQAEQRIRDAVHEAGNPLSIISNYLETLRLNLGEQDQAQDDLQLIKQEIERVGQILLRLNAPEQAPDEDGPLHLNDLVTRVGRLFERSLFTARDLTLRLNLDERSPTVVTAAPQLKQILINLLKNAAEALEPGGVVTLSTTARLSLGGRTYAALTVEDSGPGIPDAVLEQLFTPITSSKGGQHAGLGLSITKRLVDGLGGSILCKSSKAGTQFQVLIPV